MDGSAGDPSDDVPVSAVREALLDWYDSQARSIPWRGSDDPYQILIGEVMSQQTQIERVSKAWKLFLDRWPTVEALASASLSSVISFWSSNRLGYNRRAEYLHTAANQIVLEWDGEIPDSPDDLQTLKGVGPYTAHAVASLAFCSNVAVVDTNVTRVLHRFFQLGDDAEMSYDDLAANLLPPEKSDSWNNAMMDLGAMICVATPGCDSAPCPLRKWCKSYAAGTFSSPTVSTQSRFEGSRRQYRGRVIRLLADAGTTPIETIGDQIRDSYSAGDPDDVRWLLSLLDDLEADGLIDITHRSTGPDLVRLQS